MARLLNNGVVESWFKLGRWPIMHAVGLGLLTQSLLFSVGAVFASWSAISFASGKLTATGYQSAGHSWPPRSKAQGLARVKQSTKDAVTVSPLIIETMCKFSLDRN